MNEKSFNIATLHHTEEQFNMAKAKKNRNADEFLEMEEFIEQFGDDENVKEMLEKMETVEDYVFDMHTRQGQKMGRGKGIGGDRFWYEVSSNVENPDVSYRYFKDWVWKNKERIYYGKEKKE